MSTWKKILTTDDQTNNNLGSADLTITGGDSRRLVFGSASSNFAVKNNATKLVLNLTETTASMGSTVSTATLNLNTSGPTVSITGSSNLVLFDKTSELRIESEDGGAAVGFPTMDLYRNSATPANYDHLGAIEYSANDSDGNKTVFARMRSRTRDVTNGEESGYMYFDVVNNGTLKTWMEVNGDGLDLDLTLSGDAFTIESLDTGSNDSPVLQLFRNSSSPANGDDIGTIRWRADHSAGSIHTFAELEVEADDVTDGSEDAQVRLKMSDNGTVTEVLRFDVIDATTTSVTDNQNKLKNVFIRGTSLDALTNKFMHTFMFGSNNEISNTQGNANSVRVLRTVNGINMGDTSNDLDLTDADANNGIIMPFDGFVRAGSLSFQKTGGTQATVKLKAAILRSATPGTNQVVELVSISGTNSNKSFPRGHGYETIHTESDGTDNVNKFVAGDKLVVFVDVDATTTSSTYTADNFIASVTIYSEDYG